MHEIRKDPLLNRRVLIAPDRAQRPVMLESEDVAASETFDPFLEGNESQTPGETLAFRDAGTQPNGSGWRVRVIPNRFPAVSSEASAADLLPEEQTSFYPETSEGYGHHEVIVECPHYEERIERLPQSQIAEVLQAYRERIVAMHRDSRIQYVTVFKNNGEKAGASLGHSHSQLVALPFVPRTVQEEVESCQRHLEAHGVEFFSNLVAEEQRTGDRVVEETANFITICPYASRFPTEMCIVPQMSAARFEETSDELLMELAGMLQRNLLRLSILLNGPPYNYVLHNLPAGNEFNDAYRWHFEIYPRLTGIAGFECGTETFINPVPPEEAAQILRAVKLPTA